MPSGPDCLGSDLAKREFRQQLCTVIIQLLEPLLLRPKLKGVFWRLLLAS